jgi:hypothetical protein
MTVSGETRKLINTDQYTRREPHQKPVTVGSRANNHDKSLGAAIGWTRGHCNPHRLSVQRQEAVEEEEEVPWHPPPCRSKPAAEAAGAAAARLVVGERRWVGRTTAAAAAGAAEEVVQQHAPRVRVVPVEGTARSTWQQVLGAAIRCFALRAVIAGQCMRMRQSLAIEECHVQRKQAHVSNRVGASYSALLG